MLEGKNIENAVSERNFAQLGFGLMRLPQLEEGGNDIEETKKLVDAFMNAGFTYFDTAPTYHGGTSEIAAKEALVDRYPRESFQLATKMPAWAAKSLEEAQAFFERSLERTGAGYFDYYLLHQLTDEFAPLFEDYDLWNFAQKKKEKGLIKHLGFSFHDSAEVLERLLEEHPNMDFVQLQINYADWENDIIESRKCYEVARAHGLPVIVMEPVKGGSLVQLPPQVEEILRAQDPEASMASWALRFCASLPGVIAVLSGMTTMDQMQDNLRTMKAAKPLTDEESAAIDRARTTLSSIPTVPCTDCRYCMKDCPQGIHIPIIMDSLDIMAKFGDMHRAKENYVWNANNEASKCVECGTCESLCPQHIDIINQLKRATELFES